MGRILLIEDSLEVARIVQTSLKKYELVVCHNLAEARNQIQQMDSIDLILLDVGLPDGDGFGFLAQLKIQNEPFLVPVVFLTARSETADIVMGFSLGADDYIVKPFNPFEFRARIDAKIKSINDRKMETETHQIGPLKINLNQLKAFITKDGQIEQIDLTPLEFKIISFLAKNVECVFNRDQLIDQIWGNGICINDRAVDTHMSNLRRKIKVSGYTIESIYGMGYVLRRSKSVAA